MRSPIVQFPLRLSLTLTGAVTALCLFGAAPAQADMRVCNQTPNPVSIAIGYRSTSGWQSEGWWVAEPEGCASVYQGELSNRYIYMFAADDVSGGAWGGSVFMCTRDDAFTIFGVEDCLARGYERTGFFEIDTEDRTDWTVQLTPESFEPILEPDIGPDPFGGDPLEIGPDAPIPPDGAPGPDAPIDPDAPVDPDAPPDEPATEEVSP